MKKNLFAQASGIQLEEPQKYAEPLHLSAPDYTLPPSTLLDHILSFLIGFAAGFAVLFIFYRIVPLSILGGVIVGSIYIFVAAQNATQKRLRKLRTQFFDLLEASAEGLTALAEQLKALDGETRVVMEHTGRYYESVANVLHEAGLYVSAVNPLLIKEYGGNSLRKVKTDKADAMKIARYAIDNWVDLRDYTPHGYDSL